MKYRCNLIALLVICSIASYHAGVRSGVNKTAVLAKQFAESDRSFKLLLEKACTEDADDGADEVIRELIISGFQAYEGSVLILTEKPFSQEMSTREDDLVNAAIERLQSGTLELKYAVPKPESLD